MSISYLFRLQGETLSVSHIHLLISTVRIMQCQPNAKPGEWATLPIHKMISYTIPNKQGLGGILVADPMVILWQHTSVKGERGNTHISFLNTNFRFLFVLG